MKTSHLLFGIGAIILLAGGCVTKPRQSGSAITPAVISSPSADVHDFHDQMPYGIIGKRLGSRFVIYGELDYETTLPNVLWIDAVDRAYRGAPLPIEIRGIQLQKGVHYELEGYEAGEFAGDPDWSHSPSKQPFRYRSFFVVTKVIEPKITP